MQPGLEEHTSRAGSVRNDGRGGVRDDGRGGALEVYREEDDAAMQDGSNSDDETRMPIPRREKKLTDRYHVDSQSLSHEAKKTKVGPLYLD